MPLLPLKKYLKNVKVEQLAIPMVLVGISSLFFDGMCIFWACVLLDWVFQLTAC